MPCSEQRPSIFLATQQMHRSCRILPTRGQRRVSKQLGLGLRTQNGEIEGQYIVPRSAVLVAGITQTDEEPRPRSRSAEAAPAYHRRPGEAEGLLWSRTHASSPWRWRRNGAAKLREAETQGVKRFDMFPFSPLTFALTWIYRKNLYFASVHPRKFWWFGRGGAEMQMR